MPDAFRETRSGTSVLSPTGLPQTPPSHGLAIAAHGLVKRFGPVGALDGIDLAVAAGSVLGLLGPNGAGKPVTGL
jgi:ABC-type glutathione transport system ATPase component